MIPASARARTGTVRNGRYPHAAASRRSFPFSFRFSWRSCTLVSCFGSAAKPCYSVDQAAAKGGRPGNVRKGWFHMSASTSQNQRIAVVGLGSMGYGMATSLKRAGHAVTGCDVSADAVARFVKDGGAGASTPAEAAKGADIVGSG